MSSSLSTLSEPVHVGRKPDTEGPILLADWMECFRLHTVDVPANGHCFYGAFFAATAGDCDFTSLIYEGEALVEVQECRDRIQNVAADQVKVEAEFGVQYQAEQSTLVRELYPNEGWTAEAEATAVAVAKRLVKHYEDTEDVRITTTVPHYQWA